MVVVVEVVEGVEMVVLLQLVPLVLLVGLGVRGRWGADPTCRSYFQGRKQRGCKGWVNGHSTGRVAPAAAFAQHRRRCLTWSQLAATLQPYRAPCARTTAVMAVESVGC